MEKDEQDLITSADHRRACGGMIPRQLDRYSQGRVFMTIIRGNGDVESYTRAQLQGVDVTALLRREKFDSVHFDYSCVR
eukprot:CAMPEP_0206373536 /NCGR_PEP_ID=MMETSP0294-20121207/7768_1 /ASSEMBLY_ACC=CAM_ASM_000327 /TAXON_ID=39354 /ORGANISM="Heterosigma akashiwo, Strain CCMP2393" /LENGTH=78 /DNA_ID=CAMNT_0053821135 /DNA_START=136 /DNA_END=372 /DNA_ORIENTATION=+